jgi:peptidoglycan/LPS O-acetylase OafA/YrhL
LSFSIIAVFWIIGNSGWVKDFLANKFMIITSRVCLAYYLIHPMVIIFTGANSPQDIYIENSYFIFRYFGVVVLSAVFAILLTIMITYPIIGFEKMLLRRAK